MVALRTRSAGAFAVPLWLSGTCAALMFSSIGYSIGYQDMRAFSAPQPGVSEGWRDYFVSPSATIRGVGSGLSQSNDARMPEPPPAQQGHEATNPCANADGGAVADKPPEM